jgi:hypothetical protein
MHPAWPIDINVNRSEIPQAEMQARVVAGEKNLIGLKPLAPGSFPRN